MTNNKAKAPAPLPAGKRQRLPPSRNGVRRKSFGGMAYQYQRDDLRKIAHGQGMTISLYLNQLVWKDQYWREPKRKRKTRA